MILYWIQALILYLRALGAPCAAIYTNSVLSLSHGCSVALVPWCTGAMWWIEFPRQVSILWPSAYKAITIFKFGHLHVLLKEDGVWDALPLSYRGWFCSGALMHRCDVMMWSWVWMSSFCKATKGWNTEDTFRSYVLRVMSPTRYPCATPVSVAKVLTSLALWRPASVKLANWNIPAVGFDPTSSPL